MIQTIAVARMFARPFVIDYVDETNGTFKLKESSMCVDNSHVMMSEQSGALKISDNADPIHLVFYPKW